ncbi:flagellar hook-basal body complex protein FliE [Ketogulonicigenium vulgare]|uniref:Flagellar hook-basal body complex protein FliE, putative n=1 Tax=Ketogulonicigenium vulgare (strain WSH-001) TaxID=759362 RepID=F9Y4F8_KETVW|nr:flagellar hook-basal body complex protein FliE [Ketogulonicigenium vulgare]ADO43492.1 flagellar hook-basal body protein FliE [Ketogulonicigenium vulgare Y25]AEM41771.1 Flagellar hook-basal body complex protein FliE, putative [Ketogulonicigenium vulgare WSH-001]ALJ81877.1 flagellar hook-basal body protein FliE [Ketogulonicigenium vulgare]ANW35186.1 flagellar hook-basal body protein FliE [Ketogulonicigenium vulgare]AOZ55527.1 flagellar hook-basal body protein FliE [Ketogulonicigenium vulgare]
MDIRSTLASRAYDAVRAQPQVSDSAGSYFSSAAAEFAATLQQGEAAAMGAMTGDYDPHALVTALAQSELAIETAVTIRNKVVEAYQEILRMAV